MAKNGEMAKFWRNGKKWRNGEKTQNGEMAKWRNCRTKLILVKIHISKIIKI